MASCISCLARPVRPMEMPSLHLSPQSADLRMRAAPVMSRPRPPHHADNHVTLEGAIAASRSTLATNTTHPFSGNPESYENNREQFNFRELPRCITQTQTPYACGPNHLSAPTTPANSVETPYKSSKRTLHDSRNAVEGSCLTDKNFTRKQAPFRQLDASFYDW